MSSPLTRVIARPRRPAAPRLLAAAVRVRALCCMAFHTARRPLRADKGAVVSTIGGWFATEQCRRKDHHPPMSNYPVGRRPRAADPHSTLRLAALTAVAAGVVLLAAAAFVLSYPGIHAVALQAGVSPKLARLYPVIFDAMLV